MHLCGQLSAVTSSDDYDLFGVDIAPNEQSRLVFLGNLFEHQTYLGLFERLFDRAAETDRPVKRCGEHNSGPIADSVVHADHAVDDLSYRIRLLSRIATAVQGTTSRISCWKAENRAVKVVALTL